MMIINFLCHVGKLPVLSIIQMGLELNSTITVIENHNYSNLNFPP